MTTEEINNFADKVYHAKMEDIPTILEDLVKIAKSKMYSEDNMISFAMFCQTDDFELRSVNKGLLNEWFETINKK